MRDRHDGSCRKRGLLRVLVFFLLGWGVPQLASAETHEIGMKDRRFSAETMRIKVGDTVKWVNSDQEPHQVVSGQDLEDPNLGEPMMENLILIGEHFSFTFDTPGRYPYMCSLHWAKAMMTGKVAMSAEIIVEP